MSLITIFTWGWVLLFDKTFVKAPPIETPWMPWVGLMGGMIGFVVSCGSYFNSLTRHKRKESSELQSIRISKAPGANLLSIVSFLFSEKSVEGIFTPILGEWHDEYFKSLHQGRRIKARWINLRNRFHFIWVMGLSKIYELIKR
jgi:hypothetical protein